jgi:hypothetical protein
MRIKNIYRVQNKYKEGPWRGRDSIIYQYDLEALIGQSHNEYRSNHPIPSEDLTELNPHLCSLLKCGCNSISQLFYWFPERLLSSLEKDGFFVCKITLDKNDVWEGSQQVLFLDTYPIKIKKLKLEDLQDD